MLNKYPLWKNILLIVGLCFALIYALPNVFGSAPAVQISPSSTTVKIDDNLVNQVKTTLQNDNFDYKSIESDPKNILIRFTTTDTQLKAKDTLKTALGDDYIVSVNIASATPHWLSALGAQPMKLGLDLRGGVHFVLQVYVDDVITQRMQGLVKNLSDSMREANIRYAAVLQQPNQIVVGFRDQQNLMDAKDLFQRQFPELQFRTVNKEGRLQLVGQWLPEGLTKIRQNAIERTMTTLRNRVNELGVAEAVVQQQGTDRISVDLPGIQDTSRAEQILGGTATLEFRLVDSNHDARNVVGGMVPPGTRLYQFQDQPILLSDQVILTGNSITDANASFGEDGQPTVNINLGGGGESYFHRVTGENVGKRLAIIYVETRMTSQVIDGKTVVTPKKIEKVITTPVIQSALPSNFQITGIADSQEAKNLALTLRAGALPAPIDFVEERTIGPQLGAENIHMGFESIVAGFILAVIFMAVYYRTFGLVADLGLIVNLILLVSLLSILGMTLTLPGMAGIVLNVGMAVDANVLIFERIREEIRNGLTPQASIQAGYEKAFTTILDANVATLIAALVLFGIGTGPVKGFAVTLSLGLITSMLSGLVYSRAVINAIYGGRNIKSLPIGI